MILDCPWCKKVLISNHKTKLYCSFCGRVWDIRGNLLEIIIIPTLGELNENRRI